MSSNKCLLILRLLILHLLILRLLILSLLILRLLILRLLIKGLLLVRGQIPDFFRYVLCLSLLVEVTFTKLLTSLFCCGYSKASACTGGAHCHRERDQTRHRALPSLQLEVHQAIWRRQVFREGAHELHPSRPRDPPVTLSPRLLQVSSVM